MKKKGKMKVKQRGTVERAKSRNKENAKETQRGMMGKGKRFEE